MKTFLADFKFVHRRSLAFAASLPIIAAIPLVAEFIQHVIEMRVGMYDGIDGATLAERHPDRLLSGFAKTIALGLPAYFLIRWLHSGGDSRFAARFERPAAALFALVIALQALLSWLGLFVWTEGPMAIGFFVFLELQVASLIVLNCSPKAKPEFITMIVKINAIKIISHPFLEVLLIFSSFSLLWLPVQRTSCHGGKLRS